MTGINLGSFNTTNGRTTGLGFASGLDSASLIEAILASKTASVTKTEDTIDVNTTKITEIATLKTLLDRLKTTVDFLRAPPGVNNENTNFFKHTTSSLSSSTTTAASTYLSVATEAGATLATYEIDNITKALSHQIRYDGFTSKTSSITGNLSVTDNYQTSGSIAGSVLNSATPITFSNDIKGTQATIDLVFNGANEFDATDEIVFGTGADAVTITFGGGGGDDIDISGASTEAEKIALIAARMNAQTSKEASRYTYTSSGSTLTVKRIVDGSNAQASTSMNINANFTVAGGSAQEVAIGSQGSSNNPAGGALNSLGTDGNEGTTATSAVLEMIFGTENEFDATDQIVFGGTTITFGGTGGNDIDISTATSLDDKIDAIVTRMNLVATGPENTYTYSRSATGVLTMTQDTAGTISSTGNDMTITADFSKGTTDTTQTVAFGKNYKNNGSTSGSVGRSNSAVSASVSANGVDGYAAATKATVDIVFTNNVFEAADQLEFGGADMRFGSGLGDVDITVGASLAETLENIVKYMNDRTTGDEAGYSYVTDGATTITITRDVYGKDATVGTALALKANFSGGDETNLIKFGSDAASINPADALLNVAGTEGVDKTAISDAMTTHISSLSGAVTINDVKFHPGTAAATGAFTSNRVSFTATVGGVKYVSKLVELDGGDMGDPATGTGYNGLGDRIASGTVITFVKSSDGDTTSGTKDVTFNLVVGSEKSITGGDLATTETAASNYGTDIQTDLAAVTITQSPTVPPLRAGTFNLGGVDITLNEGDSLQVIEAKINATSATSGVVASIVQVSETSFSLVLKSKTTGAENKILEFADGDSSDGPTNTIQLGSDNISFTQTQAGSDASFDLDGQTITRATNNINDVIDKVTFTLVSDTPVASPPTLTVNVTSDNSIVKTGISDFLTAYNELKFYISEQSERDADNKLVEGAILGDESILSDVLVSLERQLSRTVSGITSGNADTLFEVGIDLFDFPGDTDTPETKDVFIIDDAKFDAAIAADFEALRDVFTFTFTANSPELSVFSHTNDITLTSFVLDIDDTLDKSEQVKVRDPSTNAILFYADLEGNSITGQAGTALEGLVMVYSGDGTDTITVNATKGIADTVYNVLDSYLKEGGFIDTLLDSIKDENQRLQDKVETDNLRITAEREILIESFTRLESTISGANSVLDFLQAQRDAFNANR